MINSNGSWQQPNSEQADSPYIEQRTGLKERQTDSRVPELTSFVRLVIYSYLSLEEVLQKARMISQKTKELLKVSEIPRKNKAFRWKVDSTQKCLLHEGKLEQEMKRARPILELVSEVIFDLTQLGDDSKNCHKNYENVAEIIMSLPKTFDKEKVSILHHSNKSRSYAKFDWLKCSYILSEQRPDMHLKTLQLNNITNESPLFLDILMRKCLHLSLTRCSFKATPTNKRVIPYDLFSIELDSCELDLSFTETNQSCFSKLKHLCLVKSQLSLPPSVRLENLTSLSLQGNECIK